jgi:diguanylate cyclase (GGDEF)-like protein
MLLVAGVFANLRGATVTRDVSALSRRRELRAGLESMTSTELLDATRRAVLSLYTPQQSAVWLNVHASGDPVAVARKALRLCGLDVAVDIAVEVAATGRADHGEPRYSNVARKKTGCVAGRPAVIGSRPASERVALEVQQVVTAAVRTLSTCRDARELHEVLLEVVGRLGGEVLPAGDATARAIDIDLSLGMGTPLLVAPDPQRPELAGQLQAHLPHLIDDARRVLGCLEQAKQLAAATEHDSLTGLLNRRAYERLAGRVSPGDVLILVDLDGFRQVNHTHGHLAGDQVLRIFSAVLQAQMRISEQALRLGSDEFLIVLNQPDAGAATCLLERLRTAWNQRRPLPVDFSAGIASVTGSTDAALQTADQRLHRHKYPPPTSGSPSEDSSAD